MEILKLGVSKKTITPPVGGALYGYGKGVYSESVADDLTATAFCFEQAGRRCVMVSLTLCLIGTVVAEELIKNISNRFGIPAENCIVSTTHTHSGPDTVSPEYDRGFFENILTPAVLSAVRDALSSAVPVTAGIARGNSSVGINRRERNSEGKTILGQNPEGVFNPLMTVISFKDSNDRILANIIHYGCHCTSAGKNHEITRDWAGVMTDALEDETGGITAFFNGPEGDVGPRLSNGKTTGDLSYVYEIGQVAADDAVRIFKSISGFSQVEMTPAQKTLVIPFLPRISHDEALIGYNKYKDDDGRTAQKKADHYKKILETYQNEEDDMVCHKIPQRLLRLGNIVFVGFPFEMFSEVGLRVDDPFPDLEVLSLACTCGSEGYFVTDKEIPYGGYEVGRFMIRHTQQYAPPADDYVISCTVANIHEAFDD